MLQLRSSKFPNKLKQADILLEHKKESNLSKENKRPISIFPKISNIYERCLYDQKAALFEKIFF